MGIADKGLGRTRGAYLFAKISSILVNPDIFEVDEDEEEELVEAEVVDMEGMDVETKEVVEVELDTNNDGVVDVVDGREVDI